MPTTTTNRMAVFFSLAVSFDSSSSLMFYYGFAHLGFTSIVNLKESLYTKKLLASLALGI